MRNNNDNFRKHIIRCRKPFAGVFLARSYLDQVIALVVARIELSGERQRDPSPVKSFHIEVFAILSFVHRNSSCVVCPRVLRKYIRSYYTAYSVYVKTKVWAPSLSALSELQIRRWTDGNAGVTVSETLKNEGLVVNRETRVY